MLKPLMEVIQDGKQFSPVLRDQIQALQDFMTPLKQVDMPTVELFGHGTYVRAISIPPDTYIVGHIHRYPCVNLVFGKCRVTSEAMGLQEIDGFHMFVSPGGTKRVIHTTSETMWATVHSNPDNKKKDSETMERLLTAESFDDVERYTAKDWKFLEDAQKVLDEL